MPRLNTCRTRQAKRNAQEEYTQANKEVKQSLKRDKHKFVEEIAETAERAAATGNLKGIYDATKRLCGRYSRPELPVTDKNGKSLQGKEAQLNRWAEHFEDLLNRPAPSHPPDIPPAERDLDINCDPPTEKEIEEAIRRQKSGKAAGPDYIPPEASKADIDTVHQ